MPDLVRIFTDESRVSKHRYMLQGAVWLRHEHLNELNRAFAAVRTHHGMGHGHMKWAKVSAAKLEAYIDFVDVFFQLRQDRRIKFKCLIVDTQMLDHRRFNRGDEELGFYKFYYQLLHKIVKPQLNHVVDLAHRNDVGTSRISDLQGALNNAFRRAASRHITPVRAIHTPLAKNVDGIQLADILMGAVGYHIHDLHLRPEASPAKKTLARYIAEQLGKPDLKFKSPPWEEGFNCWYIQLKEKSGSPVPSPRRAGHAT